MLERYNALRENQSWQPDNAFTKNVIPQKLSSLILTKGSLTKSLMLLSDDTFRVNVLDERIALPYFHEQRKIESSLQKWAMIRHVELEIHGEAVVFARSIIPLSLILKGKNGLADLGQKPLGQLLFKKGKLNISKRDFSQINQNKTITYARRTPYGYMGSSILVNEYFLPTLEKYIK